MNEEDYVLRDELYNAIGTIGRAIDDMDNRVVSVQSFVDIADNMYASTTTIDSLRSEMMSLIDELRIRIDSIEENMPTVSADEFNTGINRLLFG